MSVFFENGSNGFFDEMIELGTFLQYVLRQCGNLGVNQMTETIKETLSQCHQEIFRVGNLDALDKVVNVIPYPGYKGRKQFNCHYLVDSKNFKFSLSAVGFGWLATGVGYYAPTSILGYAKFLISKRPLDDKFKETLAASMYVLSKMINDPKITALNRVNYGFDMTISLCQRHYSDRMQVPPS